MTIRVRVGQGPVVIDCTPALPRVVPSAELRNECTHERYQKPFDDGSKPIQYGLIAEEVADVFPDLVARSANGQIETVKYQVLDSLLLNEVQRQQAEIASLQGQIKELQEQSSKRGKQRFPGSR